MKRPLIVLADRTLDHRLGLKLLHAAQGKGALQEHLITEIDVTRHDDDLVLRLRELIVGSEEPPIVVSFGPPTALASLLIHSPDVAACLERVVLLAGAHFTAGDATPAAEWAVHADPRSYTVLLSSGASLEFIPLDASDDVVAPPDLIRWGDTVLRAEGETVSSERYPDGPPLRATAAALWLVEPGLFSGKRVNIEVETTPGLTYGVTSVDWWGITGNGPNAFFARSADRERAQAALRELAS